MRVTAAASGAAGGRARLTITADTRKVRASKPMTTRAPMRSAARPPLAKPTTKANSVVAVRSPAAVSSSRSGTLRAASGCSHGLERRGGDRRHEQEREAGVDPDRQHHGAEADGPQEVGSDEDPTGREMFDTFAVSHCPSPRWGTEYSATTEPVSRAEPLSSRTRIVRAMRPTASPNSETSDAVQSRRNP